MPRAAQITEKRFWLLVNKTSTCWLWTGETRAGYGRFFANGKRRQAHRYVYELLVGPIAGGMVIDHICHNRACVNPDHLRIATNAQNLQNRAPMSSQTGKRNVYRLPSGRYRVQLCKDGMFYQGGIHTTIEDAVTAAKTLRDRIFTHHTD